MYRFKDETMKVPCYVWADKEQIEEEAIQQITDVSSLPFVFHHTVLCPDAHMGYGVPIGGVVATKDVIVPNFVGVDIGCGMHAVRTDCKSIEKDEIKKVMSIIRNAIPLDHNEEEQRWDCFDYAPNISVIQNQLHSARKQIGSLGGGNHFIEIQKDEEGFIWLMLHSGSRNFGYTIAKEYHKKAIELCEKWHVVLPNKDLSFLPLDSKAGEEYLVAMKYALSFAIGNRSIMIAHIMHAMNDVVGCQFTQYLDVHHNYAAKENHFGSNVIVHRKGAIRARNGELGIIPGSQGTKSYIVKGKGCIDSFCSCSHGAGRMMSRTKARITLDLDEEIARLDKKGIVHAIRTEADLDEAAGAYKDISIVMENQQDLVEIVHELSPLAVIKA